MRGGPRYEELFHRKHSNPILTAADWPYPVHTVFNAGATLLRDGTTLLLRPIADSGAHVWISYSPDLRSWGGHRLMLQARRGAWWDANKVGLSPPLIETERGWLMLYHGVRSTASGALYRLGVALFDIEQPDRLLLRGDEWVFGPEAAYETAGDVANGTFPCGTTVGRGGR